jgi:hypothetical protein
MTEFDITLGRGVREDVAAKSASVAVVFAVSPVAPATSPLAEMPYWAAIESLLVKPPSWRPQESQQSAELPRRSLEACSRYHGQLVSRVYFHPIIAAIHRAFQDHRPMVLSPDMLWLMVTQGFANHVNANAEKLRNRLVRHSGIAKIAVRRDDLQRT